jgi:hypothetical protein
MALLRQKKAHGWSTKEKRAAWGAREGPGVLMPITLANQGGLVAGLTQNFSFYAWFRALFCRLLWAGTLAD